MAVSMAGQQQIMRATSGKAPTWLREGFAAYCENAVLGKNLVHGVDYEIAKLDFNPDWSIEMRRLAALNQLKPWETMFSIELRAYMVPEYVTSFSMVTYLIRSEPQKFLAFVRGLSSGTEPQAALTGAYGRTVDELQTDWVKWLRGGR